MSGRRWEVSRCLRRTALLTALAAVFSAVASSGEGGARPLRFSFRKDKPLAYQIRVVSTAKQVVSAGKQVITTPPQSRDVTFQMSLLPDAPDEKGQWSCKVKFGGYRGKATFPAEDKKIEIAMDGKDVRVTVDGHPAVDTAAGIAAEKAEPILREAGFIAGEVTVVVDSLGQKVKIEGAPQLAKWFETGGRGLFPLVLPEMAVKQGENWEEPFDIKNIEAFVLKEPIVTKTVYTWKGPAPEAGGKAIAIEAAAKLEVKNRDAVPPRNMADMGNNLKIVLMNIATSGNAVFDPESGEFVRGSRKSTFQSEMSVKPPLGEEQVARVEGSMEVTYEPAAPAGPKP